MSFILSKWGKKKYIFALTFLQETDFSMVFFIIFHLAEFAQVLSFAINSSLSYWQEDSFLRKTITLLKYSHLETIFQANLQKSPESLIITLVFCLAISLFLILALIFKHRIINKRNHWNFLIKHCCQAVFYFVYFIMVSLMIPLLQIIVSNLQDTYFLLMRGELHSSYFNASGLALSLVLIFVLWVLYYEFF